MEHVPLMASSLLTIGHAEHAEEPPSAVSAQDGKNEMANGLLLPHNENGPSPGPPKVCPHILNANKNKKNQ